MKTYQIASDVLQAKGVQYWSVEAESEDDALSKFRRGRATFEYEEIEITRTGEGRILKADDEAMSA